MLESALKAPVWCISLTLGVCRLLRGVLCGGQYVSPKDKTLERCPQWQLTLASIVLSDQQLAWDSQRHSRRTTSCPRILNMVNWADEWVRRRACAVLSEACMLTASPQSCDRPCGGRLCISISWLAVDQLGGRHCRQCGLDRRQLDPGDVRSGHPTQTSREEAEGDGR